MPLRINRPLTGCVVSIMLAVSVSAARPPHGWEPGAFEPLTAKRIAGLPGAESAAWQAYWTASEQRLATLRERPKPDASPTAKLSTAPKGGAQIKGLPLRKNDRWYAGAEAQGLADQVAAAQSPFGGWDKGHDYQTAAAPEAVDHGGWAVGTFDNDATTTELRFLARVIAAAGEGRVKPAWRAAFDAGLQYVFAAQYPNGGFPQIYPLVGGYHDGVTFNDDAMVHVLELLRDVAEGQAPFGFVGAGERVAAQVRFRRGVHCLLAAQGRDGAGRPTVWAQQHDPLTLRAAAARNFEPVADCARESVAIVRLLMSLPQPSPEIVAAVEGAVAWFRRTGLPEERIVREPAEHRGEVQAAPGAPLLWARFYEPGTTTPIYGDRDRTIHYDLSEISPERVHGYAWHTEAPAAVLAAYPAWRERVGR